jgi:hypothetical protein
MTMMRSSRILKLSGRFPTPAFVFLLYMLILVSGATTLIASAQEPQIPETLAPPPLVRVPASERAQLRDIRDIKGHTKLSIQLAENHLVKAEQLTVTSDFSGACAELGLYRAIIQEALAFLADLREDSNRSRDNFKRLELALRGHNPRIETIRRTTPHEYAVNIKTLTEFNKDAREQALNAFYGDTVLREPKVGAQQSVVTEHGGGHSIAPEKKQP